MEKELKSEFKLITPEYATELLKNNTSNRPINKKILSYYKTLLLTRQFSTTGQGISISDNGILIDGQHRLLAIKETGVSVKMLVVSNLHFEDVFHKTDCGKSRNAGDSMAIIGVSNYSQKTSGINSYFLLNNGWSLSNSNGGRRVYMKRSIGDYIDEYTTNSALWEELNKRASTLRSKYAILKHSEIMGYMAYLIKDKKHSQEKVFSFFSQLFLCEESENATISALREKLINNLAGSYKLTPQYKKYMIVKTWNCFVSGKQISRFSFSESRDMDICFI